MPSVALHTGRPWACPHRVAVCERIAMSLASFCSSQARRAPGRGRHYRRIPGTRSWLRKHWSCRVCTVNFWVPIVSLLVGGVIGALVYDFFIRNVLMASDECPEPDIETASTLGLQEALSPGSARAGPREGCEHSEVYCRATQAANSSDNLTVPKMTGYPIRDRFESASLRPIVQGFELKRIINLAQGAEEELIG
jgi:hypothetical protein